VTVIVNMLVNIDMNFTGRKSLRTGHCQYHGVRSGVRSESL